MNFKNNLNGHNWTRQGEGLAAQQSAVRRKVPHKQWELCPLGMPAAVLSTPEAGSQESQVRDSQSRFPMHASPHVNWTTFWYCMCNLAYGLP